MAAGLAKLDVRQGDTIAIFDYDGSRYLECFFAIPMMGAVMRTVNWRLSTDQILYTIRHAEAKLIIINADFLPILENIRDKMETVKTVVVISEDESRPDRHLTLDGEYGELLKSVSTLYDFPDLDENTKATTFYTRVPSAIRRVCTSHTDN